MTKTFEAFHCLFRRPNRTEDTFHETDVDIHSKGSLKLDTDDFNLLKLVLGGPAIGLCMYLFSGEDHSSAIAIEGAEVRTEIEEHMQRVTEAIVGNNIDVHCTPIANSNPGLVSKGVHQRDASGRQNILITPEYCEAIATFIDYEESKVGGPLPAEAGDGIFAVFSLAHEIAHAEGIQHEGDANCRGVEIYNHLANELGVTSFLGDIDVLPLVQAQNYPEIYHSAGC
ncbi:MAG: hypothetical protein M3Q70_00710 [bacterium]|nr:hypothetical protein [bacterium]